MASDLISPTVASLQLSPTLEINELVQKTRAGGRKVIHLGFGEATFPIQRDVLEAHEKASCNTSYLPVAGLPSLRKSIAEYNSRRLGITIQEDQVVVAPGSKPLLFALFDILNGDVLLPRPSWVSYEPQVRCARKRLFWVETCEKDRHTITVEALEAAYQESLAMGKGARVMLINSPSNPTGKVFRPETLSVITNFCAGKGITLISDEIYSDLCYDSTDIKNSSFTMGAISDALNVVMTGGLSKTYSAGGWRIGYAIFPASSRGKLLQRATSAYASECWSTAPAPAQQASTLAFATTAKMDTYRTQVAALHAHCTTRLYKAVTSLGLTVSAPEGGFYIYPSYTPFTKELFSLGIKNSVDLSMWLLKNFGIAALPGSAFGEDDSEQGLAGGKLRLRMATSYLYFANEEQRYAIGYRVLEERVRGKMPYLPLLDEAIAALTASVRQLESLR